MPMKYLPFAALYGFANAFDASAELGETPPSPGDANYETDCVRWGLDTGCDYMYGMGDLVETQVYRAKKYQLISGGPLNTRLWRDGADGHDYDNIKVTLTCTTDRNVVNTAPGKTVDYHFNGVVDDDVMFLQSEEGGAKEPCTGRLFKPSAEPREYDGEDVTNRSTALAQPASPACESEAAYDHNSAQVFDNFVSCAADEWLVIKVYDQDRDDPIDSSQLFELDGGDFNRKEVPCLETGDEIKFYTNFAQQPGVTAGTDQCFNNRNTKYIQDTADPNFNRDLPWTPFDNCYGARGGELAALSFQDCHEKSWQFFVKADDPEAENAGSPWPMRRESVFLKASLTEIKDALSIFPTDIMRVDFYIEKAGVAKPQSFSLSPKDYTASCDNFPVADAIECQNFNVYCTAPTDNIVARVTGGGEHIYGKFPCSDLLAATDLDGADGDEKWANLQILADNLANNELLAGAGEPRTHDALVEESGNTGNFVVAATLTWHWDTYTSSTVPKCYTGDAFPFEVPHCGLREEGEDVASRAHGLADLFLHNDVLNSAISGFQVHEAMPATDIGGALDGSIFTGSNDLDPEEEPEDLPTWYDFDAFAAETGYTGAIRVDALPECGVLSVVEPIPEIDGETGAYITDGVEGQTVTAVTLGAPIVLDREALVFDPTDGNACGEEGPGDLAFSFAFETQIQGASAFVRQVAGAYGLGLQLVSLSALLALLY